MRAEQAGLGRTVAAAIPLILSAALLVLGNVLAAGARGFEVVGPTNALLTSLSFFVFSVVAFIVILRGSHRVGWLFAVSGLAWGILSFSDAVVEYTRIFEAGTVPGEDVFVWSSSWWEFIGVGATPVLLLLVFPNGLLRHPRSRYLVALTVVAVAMGILGSALAPGPLEDWPTVSNPYGLRGAPGEIFDVLKDLGWVLLALALIFSTRDFIRRFRGAGVVERQQMKWMALAGMFVALFLGFWAVSEGLFGEDAIAEAAQGLALVPVPLAAGIAIVRYRLYDVDVIINRAAIYGLLSAILAALYFGLVVVLQLIVNSFTTDSDLVVAASTLVVAGLFSPLRTRVQSFIDQRFYRSRYDAAETLNAFSARFRDQVDLETIKTELIGAVGTTMKPRHVSLWLRSGEERG